MEREHGAEAGEERAPHNFIRAIIDADLERGAYQQVVTRFPPEPNGYLHIGHAKSICLNFGLARDYNGRCHLRFDDTNPVKEDVEYVESIQADVRWLGFDWGEHLHFASDYFGQMYEWAEQLVRDGKAYVDSQSAEEISAGRGALGHPGTPSPYRDRSVEENLDLLRRMRAGEFPDGAHVLRAKIDMTSPNMLMRDPLLYRIRHATHHRTGDDWCIYPMYDYAHCLEDAVEDITHSICTLEFENNRELYDWVLDELGFEEPRPHQHEFARLALAYTITSKRKLLKLVQDGVVSGWDDPRMPTISGLRRRGVTPEAIHAFCDMIGVARANSLVDMGKLEFSIRDDLNTRAPRVMCVIDPLKVTLTNYPEGQVEWFDASYWPHDVPRTGSRMLPFTRELYIEREDFSDDPPKGFKRLVPGGEVRLRHGYFIRCDEVVRDDTGAIIELLCTYDPETRGSTPEGRARPKGTIHWVSATEGLPCEARLYDRLFTVERPDADEDVDFTEHLNPDSLKLCRAVIEPSVRLEAPGTHYQFERQGYFVSDYKSSSPDALIFNRVVTLKDSWARQQAREAEPEVAAAPAPKKPEAPPQPAKNPSEERDRIREADPELAARHARYLAAGLSDDNADILSGELELSDLFERAWAASPEHGQAVANWIVNDVLRVAKETGSLAALPFTPEAIGQLVGLIADDTISSRAAKDVFEVLCAEGGDPAAIVEARGLTQISSPEKINALIEQVLEKNPTQLADYRAGKTQLLGFFVGQLMKASRGKADPQLSRELLLARLDA